MDMGHFAIYAFATIGGGAVGFGGLLAHVGPRKLGWTILVVGAIFIIGACYFVFSV
jgi:hypothetical protein